MYAARQDKKLLSRTISKGICKSKNNSLYPLVLCTPVQRTVIIAVETSSDIDRQYIFNSAKRVGVRKKGTDIIQINSNIRKFNHKSLVVPNNRTLNLDEQLIIVSHGLLPKNGKEPMFCGKTPKSLANILSHSGVLPKSYAGQIYLDGCHTGEPDYTTGGSLGDKTSFAEKFKNHLQNNGFKENFTVKGNLGTAVTGKTNKPNENSDDFDILGTEWIYINSQNMNLIKQRITECILSNPMKYRNLLNYIISSNGLRQLGRYYSTVMENGKRQERIRGEFAKVIY